MAASASPSKTASIPFASKLAPTGIASMPHFPANPLNLWELACQRGGLCLTVLNRVDPIREQARSHRDRIHAARSCQPTGPVGAGLPAMAASASPSKTASIPFASKLAPTGVASIPHFPANPLDLWELACQRWRPLPHRPKPRRSHSRASSLPQGSHPSRTFRPTHRDRLHPALSCQTTEPVGASLLAKASVASPSSYCAGGVGSGSLVTRSNPHRPEVLPKAP